MGGGGRPSSGGSRRRHRNEGCTIKSKKGDAWCEWGWVGGMVTPLLLVCHPLELKPCGKHCLLEIIINFCSAYISLYMHVTYVSRSQSLGSNHVVPGPYKT